MFTRISTALIALAFLAPTNLLAGFVEEQRSERAKEFRQLCVMVVSRATDSSTKAQAAKFLELSRLNAWQNYAGRSIHATYLEHGTNAAGAPVVYLETANRTQYAVKIDILSTDSQLIADELKWLKPAIARDAQRLEDEYQARQLAAAEARRQRELARQNRVGVSSAFATYTYPTIAPHPVVYRSWYQPRTYVTRFYSTSPYHPWVRRSLTTVDSSISGSSGTVLRLSR